ncbi:MAG: hypothetical protein LBU34_05460 [Planctomycetaceae bacterium]|jgi:hypothetical protein|nr:hypothetical protein [Planctomycetaceae bacterium]
MKKLTTKCLFLCFITFSFALPVYAVQLKVGTARTDITPPKRVPLQGQFHLRLSQGVETPLTANVTALETVDGEKSLDNVIFVSVDVVGISFDLQKAIQDQVVVKDASIDVQKIVINATHTHTAPTLRLNLPALPKSEDIMDFPEAINFTAERVATAIVTAWQNRKLGKTAYGLDFAVVAFSRRAVYADGHAVMYGNSNDPNFCHYENMEDHDLGTLFFWDENDRLLSVIVNISCPSQVVEGDYKINADFWHPVREKLAERFGKDVVILGWCSPAGDNSPHVQYRNAAINRMNSLRNLNEMQEIARKIDRAVTDTYETVKNAKVSDVPLIHRVETLQLFMRKVTESEYSASKAEWEHQNNLLKSNPDKAPAEVSWMARSWYGNVVERYEAQQKDPNVRYPTTIHVIRLGDTVICTNQFELFSDFGIQMKTQSPAIQTFLIQLVGVGTYLPTERAVRGGSYSAVIQSNPVGPEGGRQLVKRTVELMKELWK